MSYELGNVHKQITKHEYFMTVFVIVLDFSESQENNIKRIFMVFYKTTRKGRKFSK